MSKAAQKLGGEVIAFLERQRLEPTPGNYALGYHFLARTNEAIAGAVARATDGGVRITQEEADDIMMRSGSASAQATPAADDGREELRHQLLRLTEIAATQTTAASDFGRDLATGLESMGEAGAAIAGVVGTMIERTALAERQLAQAAEETQRLRQDLEAARNDATLDALTGLPNRRAIDARLEALERKGRPRVVAFCDVDRFKSVNDRFGHAVGDRVLKGVAETLRNGCPKDAVVARWGGEEFVMVFEHGEVAEAARVVDAAREALCARRFKLRDTDEPLGVVSFSAGVAAGTGATADIVAEADALLYDAKEQGRNRVITR